MAAAELTSAHLLQLVLIKSIKGTLFLNCGGIKQEVKGAVPCLVNSPKNGSELPANTMLTIACTLKEGKQVTGACTEPKAACEKLAGEPLLADLGGFEKASELLEVLGSHDEMVTFDF
jgi:hypothetical protein